MILYQSSFSPIETAPLAGTPDVSKVAVSRCGCQRFEPLARSPESTSVVDRALRHVAPLAEHTEVTITPTSAS